MFLPNPKQRQRVASDPQFDVAVFQTQSRPVVDPQFVGKAPVPFPLRARSRTPRRHPHPHHTQHSIDLTSPRKHPPPPDTARHLANTMAVCRAPTRVCVSGPDWGIVRYKKWFAGAEKAYSALVLRMPRREIRVAEVQVPVNTAAALHLLKARRLERCFLDLDCENANIEEIVLVRAMGMGEGEAASAVESS